MRKVIMALSLVSFGLLGTSQWLPICTNLWIFTDPMKAGAWSTFPSQSVMNTFDTAGLGLMVVPLALFYIYAYQQDKVRVRQFKRWGIVGKSLLEILRLKEEKLKPYQRHLLFYFAVLKMGITIIALLQLIVSQICQTILNTIPFPSDANIKLFIIHADTYNKNIPHIQSMFNFILTPFMPLLIFICALMSKDLKKIAAVRDGIEDIAGEI